MNKQISVLAAIAILALGLAGWLSQSPSKGQFESTLLFTDLQDMANQIDSVEIENAQGMLFTAKKSEESWLATIDLKQSGYPISQSKVSDFVETLMRIKLVEAKTSKPKNYIRLGLQPINTIDSLASLVTLKAGNNSWQVLVGNKVTAGDGQYILKPEGSQTWRTDKTISLPIDKVSWLRQPILPFLEQDISSISRVDSLDWQITRAASGDFILLNMPKERELEYDSILNSIASSLISLDFEKLFAVDEDLFQPSQVLTQLEVSTKEGQIFQVVISELDDQHFVSFSSNGRPEYWQKWNYQISNFSAQQLIKTLDDFLAEEAPVKNVSDIVSQAVDEGEELN